MQKLCNDILSAIKTADVVGYSIDNDRAQVNKYLTIPKNIHRPCHFKAIFRLFLRSGSVIPRRVLDSMARFRGKCFKLKTSTTWTPQSIFRCLEPRRLHEQGARLPVPATRPAGSEWPGAAPGQSVRPRRIRPGRRPPAPRTVRIVAIPT